MVRSSVKRSKRLKGIFSADGQEIVEKKQGVVDYDIGTHNVSVRIEGLVISDLPKQNLLQVDGDRFQKDWPLS
nr:pentatricopeptide repeat-containing protein At2g41720 isoform X1 [Ipomoea trifida]GMC48764.1 pentatricopeptide repeat-containing protein At2g41720 [Ipomoea batatas]GMC50961.1 pentatricopeptide repeat-containing protein At2g41720 [Ipomoea batatas]